MIWILFLTILILTIIFLNFHPVFWGSSKTFNSPNYKNNKFHNIDDKVKVSVPEDCLFKMVLEYFFWWSTQRVPEEINTLKFKKEDLKNDSFVWFWHSTILINLWGSKIITDPVFYEASPVFIWWKPFKYTNTPKIEDLPEIDTVIISHDHYDHLDYKAIEKLDKKVKKYLVPLWVKSHLIKWGISDKKITEFDWYQSKKIDWINFVFTPTQHFSGRGLTNRNSTLWGSWVIKSDNLNVYFSWDSWYFSWFKTIWEKYGPFDLSFIENWAYNKNWKFIHMLPEESVQAGLDLKSKKVMPIHWGKFDLSFHSWYEPIERFTKSAQEKKLDYTTPKIWQIFNKDSTFKDSWWKNITK